MKQLNFPKYVFRFKKDAADNVLIFDVVRKKWLALSPEEWVRQHWVTFFIQELNVPIVNIVLESGISVLERKKRTDLVIYKNAVPVLILECKAPEVKINQKVLNQIVNYNRVHKVKYFVMSNGLEHLYFEINYEKSEITPIKNLPKFPLL